MKLLFIITQSELGGAQRWVFDTIAALNKKECEAAVAAGSYRTHKSDWSDGTDKTDKSNGADWSYPLLEKLSRRQIKTYPLRHLTREINPVKDLLGLIEIYRLIKQEQPDILQLCSTKAGLLGSLAAQIYNKLSVQYPDDRQDIVSKCRIIYRIGGWAFNDPRPWWQKKLFLWLEKLTAPLKDKIIVNSRHDYEQALKLKIADKNKLVLLYNGISLNEKDVPLLFFKIGADPVQHHKDAPCCHKDAPRRHSEFISESIQKSTEILKQVQDDKRNIPNNKPQVQDDKRNIPNNKPQVQDDKRNIPDNKLIVGSIANFYPTKGLSFLIKAAALMRKDSQPPTSNFQLLIVGDGPQRPLLEKLIKKHGVENIVKLVGQKDNPWRYFAEQGGIDIFVIPSVKEGMPYVLLEAMANGLPIIATRVGGIPEIIENEKSGLIVPPRDEKSLVEAISRLINNPQLRGKLGKNARQRVRDFSLEQMTAKYEKLINSLI